MKWPVLALMACCATACSGPIEATNCSVQASPRRPPVLHASLVSHSEKAITHVGVLVSAHGLRGTSGSLVEYEFGVSLAPYGRLANVTGREYDPEQPPLFTTAAYLGTISSCWARFVTYADGTTWSVSPL